MTPTIDYQRITALATAIEGLTEEERFLLDGALLDRTVFQVSQEKFNAFLKLLDEPPVYSERLQKLLATPSPWE